MPIVYDDPVAPEPVKPPKPVYPEPEYADAGPAMANKVMLAGARIAETYKDVDEGVITTAPDTTFWASVDKADPKLTYWFNDATVFASRVWGSEGMAPIVAAELLEMDPPRMEATLATLRWLNANQTGIENANIYGVPQDTRSKDELIAYILSGQPVSGLNTQEQAVALSFSEEMLSALEPLADVGISGEYKKAIQMGYTGDVSYALSEDDTAQLENAAEQLKDMLGGATMDFSDTAGIARVLGLPGATGDLGIEQVRKLGEGVIVLDEEWAKTHFAEAYGVQLWLEQNHPGMRVEIGPEGAIGSLVDKFGQTVDYVSAPFAAGIGQVAELAERIGRSPEDKQAMLDAADELEGRINSGELSPEETAQALREQAFLIENATDDVGWERFKDDLDRNTSPSVLGAGFADTVLRAADMMPGDPGYDFAHATLFLASNIVFDPTTWVLPVIGGAKAGRYVAKVPFAALKAKYATMEDYARALSKGLLSNEDALAEATRVFAEGARTGYVVPVIGNSWIKNAVYARLARTPEELAVTRPFQDAVARLWRLKAELGKEFAPAIQRGLGVSGEVAAYLGRTGSEADMGIAVLRAQMGLTWKASNLAELEARLSNINTRLGNITMEYGPRGEMRWVEGENVVSSDELLSLRAERLWLMDTTRGRDWMRPMPQYLTPKAFRRLERMVDAPYGTYGKAMRSLLESVERFPGNLLDLPNSTRLAESYTTHGQRYFISLRNLYRPTGAGELLSLPSTSLDAKMLRGLRDEVRILSLEDSYQALWDMGEFMGIRRSRMRELMMPWSNGELRTSDESYRWLTRTWKSMVEESPHIPAWAEEDLTTMWKSSIMDDRSAGYVAESVTGTNGVAFRDVSPTIYRLSDEGLRIGKPAIEADMLQAWRLPNLDEMRRYMTRMGQTRGYWEKFGGKGVKAINTGLQAIEQSWEWVASWWKMGTLGTRLLGALPLRIMSEEMLRMAGYDYASMVWHPAEWFASTRWGIGSAEADIRLFADSPIHALGAAVQDMSSRSPYYLARNGRRLVILDDEKNFAGVYFRAISNRLGAMHSSYSARILGENIDDIPEAVRILGSNQRGREMLEYWARDGVLTSEQGAERVAEELRQLMGSGPGADVVRVAMRRGSVMVDDTFQISETGTRYTLGTSEFGDLLKRMQAEGYWKPPDTKLAVSAGDYLPMEKEAALRRMASAAFRYGYAAPDLAAARSPLFRQMAARNYRNLIARGYRPQDAVRLARAEAARGVSDIMFTIGSKTSGEWAIRNFMPFFPAYRELATTWLWRLPHRIGEGTWLLGATAMSRRVDYWMQFFKDVGLISEDREGKPVVRMPFMGQLASLLTGTDVRFEAAAPLESFAGVLPVPMGLFDESDTGEALPWHQRLRGVLPSLGGPATVTLGALNKVLDGKLDTAEDWLTMYGTDQSLMPFAIDRLLGAFGVDPIFASNTTADMSKAMRTWATIDGMRLAMRRLPYPSVEDFDADGDGDLSPAEQKDLTAAVTKWSESVISAGEHYQSRMYILRGLASMMMPFSVRYEDDLKAEMGTLWSLVNVLPDAVGGGRLRSAMIDAFMAENPDLGAYMTGKSWDTRLVDDPDESFDEYMEAVRSGAVKVRTPEEFAIFALGMNAYSIYQSRVDAIWAEAGDTPAERLLNFGAREDAAALRDAWDDFLDYTRTLPPALGMTQSFADMFEQYQNYISARDADAPRLSIEQQQFLEFDRSMRDMSTYFSPNPETSADYYKMRDRIYTTLDRMGTSSDMAKATNWWYDGVQGPYYDKVNALYDKLDALPHDDPKRGLIYNQIRELADSYAVITNAEHPEWGEFPPPEAYAFAKLSAPEQRQQVASWAAMKPEWLTRFQREQVGFDVPEGKQDEASKLASIMARKEAAFDRWLIEKDTTSTSTMAVEERKEIDRLIAEKAKDLGLADYYAQMQEPAFMRVGRALGLDSETPLWGNVAHWATSMRRQIEEMGYSPGGASYPAEWSHRWLIDKVEQFRRNNDLFRVITDELAMALGEDGKPLPVEDLTRALFFDKYIP